MMHLFANLHHIAAKRGDGLRPELRRLLEQPNADSETDCASAASGDHEGRRTARSGSDFAPTDTDALHHGVSRLPANPK
jgi:hypothetical protein